MNAPLFVISQIGQIKHAEALIRHLGIQDATAGIIWTSRNGKMPSQIINAINREFFSNVLPVEIPFGSNSMNLALIRTNEKRYKRLIDDAMPSELFVCSHERHYSLLIREASNRGIPVHLFEEGAGSYKGLHDDYIAFPTPSLRKQFKGVYQALWQKTPLIQRVILPIWHIITDLVHFPHRIWKTFKALYSLPVFQEKRIRRQDPEFADGWKDFDRVYSSEPALMRKIVNAREYVEIRALYDDPDLVVQTQAIIERYSIDDKTALFASQRYDVDNVTLTTAVVDTLIRLANETGWRILIKLHPKEDAVTALRYDEAVAMAAGKITVIKDETPPAEYLAVHSDMPAVISISSSTLIYAPQQRNNLRAISIGNEVLHKLDGIDQPGVTMIRQHVKLMMPIPHIEHSQGIGVPFSSASYEAQPS